MFKKILKWVGVGVAVLVGLLIIAGIASLLVSRVRGNKTYDVAAANLTIPTDDASIREGARLTAIRACSECHGDNFEGILLFEDPAMGSFTRAISLEAKGAMLAHSRPRIGTGPFATVSTRPASLS